MTRTAFAFHTPVWVPDAEIHYAMVEVEYPNCDECGDMLAPEERAGGICWGCAHKVCVVCGEALNWSKKRWRHRGHMRNHIPQPVKPTSK